MSNFRSLLIVFFFIVNYNFSQTTDLSVVVSAQNLSGNDISQAHIYEEFQYVITIINSGDTVNDATFSQAVNSEVTVISYTSQNAQGGSSEVGNFNLVGSTLTGSINNMPNNSSVEVKVVVKAPITIGGIATQVSVTAPDGIIDTDESNNQSIISIDITDVDIDFSVVHSQFNPNEGTGISAWNDIVTYEFTITNNSVIDYPLTGFIGNLNLLSSSNFGFPNVELISLSCIASSGGTDCPTINLNTGSPVTVSSSAEILTYESSIIFTSGGSLTFHVEYKYLDPTCSFETGNINVESFIELILNHDNVSSNESNLVTTNLLTAEPCILTDPCIDNIQVSPPEGQMVTWGEEVTFETTVCNNGPADAPIIVFFQNITQNIPWEIVSVNCIDSSNGITCNDVTTSISPIGTYWHSNDFIMPAGATITFETVIKFIEPECTYNPLEATIAHVRASLSLTSNDVYDTVFINNRDNDFISLPPISESCDGNGIDISVEKTQIHPQLPEGSSLDNTTSWGMITYEITVSNSSDEDTSILLKDFITGQQAIGTLVSIDCVSTTGNANCFPINNTNIDVPLDGIPDNGENDIFWQILETDDWVLPAQSSVTFHAVVNWEPICSLLGIPANNNVEISHANSNADDNLSNNSSLVTTYFAPCVDLVVQTFPEYTTMNVNQDFDWIVDISNSITSSAAVNILFEDLLDDVFTITGTPTCQVTSGTASCITTFDISDNYISGTIPLMEAESTIRIIIPVSAPSFGGAFTNIAEATPSAINNEEITPETNISISNVQVISPTLVKSFEPSEIFVGYESTLTFTINNIETNSSQSNLSFIDNLPNGLFLSGEPYWVNSNGCTGNFVGGINDDFVGINNLTFPEGVSSCSFAVVVSSNVIGQYLNNDANFSNQVNIDTSQASSTLNVVEDTTDVDIQVLKTVFPEEVAYGETVEFTITVTNIGTTTATSIEISEILPSGYILESTSTSIGTYDITTGVWMVDELLPNEFETLTIIATVISTSNLLNTASLFDLNEIDRDDTNNSSSAIIEVNNCLTVPDGISPNGDNYNSTLIIPCIEDYDSNILRIYNRYGTLIYEASNYDNSWNGIPNRGPSRSNNVVPVGTYFYVLNLGETIETLSGWIYINY